MKILFAASQSRIRIALGEYGEQLAAEIEKKIAEEVERLRADMNLKRASDDGEVVLLPVSRDDPNSAIKCR